MIMTCTGTYSQKPLHSVSPEKCPQIFERVFWGLFGAIHAIAVATLEADEAIASSNFLKIMGISSPKGANRGDSGQFWSLRLVWF